MNRRTAIAGAALAVAMSGSVAAAGPAGATPDSGKAFGWTSNFNGSKAGWSNVVGNWTLRPGNLYAKGIPGKRVSVKHVNNYTNFQYTVRMKRWGNSTGVAANAVVVRGNPSSLTADGHWRPSYLFQYTNNGYYGVFRIDASGSPAALVDWTKVTGVISKSGYNTVWVGLSGSYFDFHINGVHLWSGNDSALTFGNVGISNFTEAGKTSETWIDSASLRAWTPGIERATHGPVGALVGGGSVDQAPR